MICLVCKRDFPDRDFMNNTSICYRCVYKSKICKKNFPKIEVKTTCRECGKEMPKENKSQRKVYCSDECYMTGNKKKINKHWTKALRKTVPLMP